MPPRVSIAHIIWHLEVGGGEQFLLDLVRTMDRRFAHHVICVGPGGRLEPAFATLGVPVTCLHKPRGLGLATTVRLARLLRRRRFDLVQVHGEAGVFWGIPAARLADARPLCSLVYQNYPETRGKMAAAKVLLPRADVVVAGSNDVQRFVIESFRVPATRVRRIYCGVDTTAFETVRRDRMAPAAQAIVTVGRLVERKGHDVLLRAFARIAGRFPDLSLWIVGDGPRRPQLEVLARNLQIDRRVRFPGTVHPTVGVLRDAVLFVFPSLVEPQGLTLLEAFAAGVPVIASRTGGIVEMLEDGREGLLVRPGDVDDLAGRLVELLEQPVRRQALAAAATRRVADFNIRTVARQYEALFDELLSPWRHVRA